MAILFFMTTNAFSAQYTFRPRVSARETYTDNVFRTENNTESDYITDISAGGDLQVRGKTSGMGLSFDPAFVTYADGSKDDTWRLPATLDIWNDFSIRTRFRIFDRFLRSEDPDDNRAVIREEDGRIEAPGDTTVRRGRSVYYTNYATARLDHQFGKDDSIYGQFLHSLRRENGSDSNDGNDNDRFAPSAGLTYWFGPKWGTTIDATYTKAKFDDSEDYQDIQGIFQLNTRITPHFQLFGRHGYANRNNDGDLEDDYQVHAPSAGFIYELAKDARISLGGGYFYQDIDGGDSEQGFFVNADVYKLWAYQRWNARLQGQAGLDRNDFGNERLGFEWFAAILGNATYNFTRNFFGNVNGRYRYSDFINENRKDNRFAVGAGLGWLPTTWLKLTLDYSFQKFDSTDSEDYDENRAWFRITLQPEKPYRFLD
jgi:hypothetical protein